MNAQFFYLYDVLTALMAVLTERGIGADLLTPISPIAGELRIGDTSVLETQNLAIEPHRNCLASREGGFEWSGSGAAVIEIDATLLTVRLQR